MFHFRRALLAVVALTSALLAFQPATAAALPPAPPAPTVEQTASSRQEIRLAVTIPPLALTSAEVGGSRYTRFDLSGYERAQTPGLPELPVLRRMVRVPAGAQVQVEVIENTAQTRTLADYGQSEPVCPVQGPAPKCGEPPAPTLPDSELYSRNGFYPSEPVRITADVTERGQRLVELEIWPVQYNPVSGELRASSRIELRIHFTGASLSATGQSLGLAQPDAAGDFEGGTNYLIVTADALAEGIGPLAALKQAQGFTVTTLTFSQAGGTREAVRATIATLNPRPDYLLLVGDTNLLPAWTGSETRTETDLYYAALDGAGDFTPDLYAGRLPARDLNQLAQMTANLAAFSQQAAPPAWANRISFAATNDPNYYHLAEASHDYVIDVHTFWRGFLGDFPTQNLPGGDRIYAIREAATDDDLHAMLSRGRSLIVYSGHGSRYGWSDPNLTAADIQSYAPAGVYSFALGFACQTSQFNRYDVSFGETWLQQANRGAVAYLGSSHYTYWNPDDTLERAIFDRLFDPAHPNASIGQAVYAGMAAVRQTYGDSGVTGGRYYWEVYNLLGDPSAVPLSVPNPDDILPLFLPSISR